MTRFARKNGVCEKREDKKKKEEATDWTAMNANGDHDKEEKKNDNNNNENEKVYDRKINDSSKQECRPKRKYEDFEKPVRHYFKHIDIAVLEELKQLKKNRKITMHEYFQQVKLQARSNQRRLQRQLERESSRCCFKCRRLGHSINDCPMIKADSEQGTGVCYKCGSTEHSVSACKAKVEPNHYPYAKCFICNETGHITKQCPDNPKGLYPNGGCCKNCGSVEHFYRDCPEVQKQNLLAEVKTAKKFKPSENLDNLSDEGDSKKIIDADYHSRPKKKVISFTK